MKKILLALLVLGAVSCNEDNSSTTKSDKDTSIVVTKDTTLVVKDTTITIDTLKK